MIVIVMGVAGSGKTTIGSRLADELGCHYYDGDDFHPASNIEKMRNNIPLTDDDRQPWLASLRSLIDNHIQQGKQAVIACSALKRSHRQQLGRDLPGVHFVYLQGSYETIWERLKKRKDHFMKPEMLKSQFDALEEPTRDVLIFNVEEDPDEIVTTIMKSLKSIDARQGDDA